MTKSILKGHVLAIDFGTSFSTMCRLNPSTHIPEVIKNAQGQDKTPSLVFFGPGETLVGEAADCVLADSYRLPHADRVNIQVRTVISPKTTLLHNNNPLPIPGSLVRPVDAVANILSELKRTAEELCFHGPVEHAVLTHPVTFTETAKRRLQTAAKQAGLPHITMLEEPVAAALGYVASGSEVGDNILVYDLGGGTFDLSFVQRNSDGTFHIPLESMGLPKCGGDYFDQALYNHLDRRCHEEHGVGFALDSQTCDKHVWRQCRIMKERLTTTSAITFSTLIKRDEKDVGFTCRLTREEFEEVIKPLVFQTIQQTEQMLARIKDAGHQVDTVLFVGGATRVPMVQQEVARILPLPPTKTMYADVAVAMGAAASVAFRRPHCRNCNTSLDEEDCFCTKCGTRRDVPTLESCNVCPQCKATLIGDGAFCTQCGHSLGNRTPLTGVSPLQSPAPLVLADCASVHRDGQWWSNYQVRVVLSADSLELVPLHYQQNVMSAERSDRIALSSIANVVRSEMLGVTLKRIVVTTITGERFSLGFSITHNVDELLSLLRDAAKRSREEFSSTARRT